MEMRQHHEFVDLFLLKESQQTVAEIIPNRNILGQSNKLMTPQIQKFYKSVMNQKKKRKNIYLNQKVEKRERKSNTQKETYFHLLM